MRLLDELHQKTLERLLEWNGLLIQKDGEKTTSQSLYKHYGKWCLRRGFKPVFLGTWGQFMGERYPKTVSHGLRVYVGVVLPTEEP